MFPRCVRFNSDVLCLLNNKEYIYINSNKDIKDCLPQIFLKKTKECEYLSYLGRVNKMIIDYHTTADSNLKILQKISKRLAQKKPFCEYLKTSKGLLKVESVTL